MRLDENGNLVPKKGWWQTIKEIPGKVKDKFKGPQMTVSEAPKQE
jgi:hypothetical protein